MKIKVIFTGGTIGSSVGSDGYISPNGNQPYKLLEMYKNKNGLDDIIFDAEEPYRILSENMDAAHANQLIQVVDKALKDSDAEGIIVTHGTDTLQYSASILGYVFGTKTIPVLLVSSDFPLEDARANGSINFAYAVDFIRHHRGTGVYVSYCNVGGCPTIHRATRLLSHPQYSADVVSVQGQYTGKYTGSGDVPAMAEYVPNEVYRVPAHAYDSMQLLAKQPEILKLSADGGSILWVRPYVGMRYPELGDEHRAVLLDSYHSGTIGITEELRQFMKKAAQRQIPVFLTGITAGEHVYETVGAYRELGIHVLPEISNIAAYCKLWLAVSNGLALTETMQACIAEDCQTI